MLEFIRRLFGNLSSKEFVSHAEGRALRETDSSPAVPPTPSLSAEVQELHGSGLGSGPVELATSSQLEFLQALGFSGKRMTQAEANAFLRRILRPIDYALGKTFKNPHCLSEAELLPLQIALVRWPHYSQLPRYDLHPGGHPRTSPHRKLTDEERSFIIETARQTLLPAAFGRLIINRVRKRAA